MLAISKKQVATAEADQQKTTQELEQLKLGDVSTEIEPAQAPDTRSPPGSSSAPLPPFSQGPSQAASPAGSAKSTNPFDRFMSKSMSPQATGGSHISSGKPSPFSQPSALPAAAAIGGAALAGTHATQDLEGSKPPPAHPSKDASDDPFAPSSQAAVQTSSDPFGGSTEPVAGNAPTFAASFDDNFEQSFTSPAPVTSPAGQPQGAFDDTAFDGFDKAATTSELQEAGAPTSKEGSSDKRFPPLEEPGSEVSSSRAAVEEKGDDSSGDEDDGPEDLDNPRSNTRTPQLPGAFTEEGRSSVPKTDPLPVVGTASATPVDHQASKGRPVSNDFDSDFVDLAPSTTSAPGVSQEDDKFGDDFNFDDFGSNDEHPIGKPQSQTAVSAASPQFDDAFGDDTFNPAASSAKPAHKNGDAFGSDFDDAFDASSAAASASAVPAVSPGLPSDPPAVQGKSKLKLQCCSLWGPGQN